MAGISGDNHTHAILFGFFNRHGHGLVADYLAHTVVSIHYSGGGEVLDYFKFRDRLLDSGLDAVQIDGLKTVDAMGFDSPLVRFQQDISADFSVFSGNAVAYKSVDHKAGDGFPIHDIRFRHVSSS